jgi:ribonuclease P protein component
VMFCLPRMVSLKHQDDFRSLFSKSQKVTCNHWLALYRSNHLDKSRLGIVIAKRRVRSAVKRNLIRRIVRESFRHYQAAIKGLDIVVLIRSDNSFPWLANNSTNNSSNSNSNSKAAMRSDIDNLWQQLIHSSTPRLNRQ